MARYLPEPKTKSGTALLISKEHVISNCKFGLLNYDRFPDIQLGQMLCLSLLFFAVYAYIYIDSMLWR